MVLSTSISLAESITKFPDIVSILLRHADESNAQSLLRDLTKEFGWMSEYRPEYLGIESDEAEEGEELD